MKKQSLAISLALLVSVLLSACSLLPLDPIPNSPTPPTPAPVTLTPFLESGSITGRVWQDRCGLADGTLGLNCVPLSDGRYRADGILQPEEPGLGGITIYLGLTCPAMPDIQTVTAADGSFAFRGLPPGIYCLTVDPGKPGNELVVAGHWTSPLVDQAMAPASLIVSVLEGESKAHVNFGRDATWGALPPTAAPTATPMVPTITPSVTRTPTPTCVDRLTFIGDVTVPDRSNVLPGTTFVKTWRLRNDGSCAWGPNYALIFYGGHNLQGPAAAPLAGSVQPGQTADVSVTLVAPTGNGTYRGEWILRNASGGMLGVGPTGTAPFWVQIVVGPTATPTSTTAIVNWRGEYFNNRNLSGAPLLVRDDAGLEFNWGAGSPATGLEVDELSARWTRTLSFNAGLYRFSAIADDGVRLWIDGQPVLDDWRDGGAGTVSGEIVLAQGTHTLRVEYYEATGLASLKLWWEAVTGSPTPTRTQTATATPTVTATQADAPVITDFTIVPSSVRRGDPVTLTWNVTGAERVTLWRLDARGRLAEPNGLIVPAAGSMVMDPHDPLNLTYSFYLHATAGSQFATGIVTALVCDTELCTS